MNNDKFPDLGLFVSFENGEERIHVRIVPLETKDFRFGLSLEETFIGEDKEKRAEEFAIKVQKYLNSWKKYILSKGK